MVSLLEWIGELISPGTYGSVELGPDEPERESGYLMLLKFLLSASLLVLINAALFGYVIPATPGSVTIVVVVHLLYFLVAYFVRPQPDTSNLGLFGTILDDPLSVSDDVNRFLLFLQAFLFPGRFVADAIVYIIPPLRRRRWAASRKEARSLPPLPRWLADLSIPLCWGVLCLGSGGVAFLAWRQAKATETWQPVEAVVVGRSTDGGTLADAVMQVEYQYGGKTYQCEIPGYSVENRITVSVDPVQPSRATFESEVSWARFAGWMSLSVVGGLGLLSWLVLATWPHLAAD